MKNMPHSLPRAQQSMLGFTSLISPSALKGPCISWAVKHFCGCVENFEMPISLFHRNPNLGYIDEHL